MITASASWFIKEEEDVEVVKGFAHLNMNIQLAFYEREKAEKFMWHPGLIEAKDNITSIHLPKHLTVSDYKSDGIVSELKNLYGTNLFVVHPWADDLPNIVDTVREQEMVLCLETFKKGGASPFSLLAQFGDELQTEHLGLCVDFSHLETDLVTVGFIKGLLPYTKMWHVSNRLGKQQHLPIFVQDADTHAHRVVARVLDVPNFPVQEIVLEYMPQYQRQLTKQYFWLHSYVIQKRKKIRSV